MTQIQWYPGHMEKAKRQMLEAIKTVDMVIEIRDSRIPNASKNPLIDKLINNKPRLIVLSKKDKADDAQTKLWIQKLSNDTTMCIALDLTKDNVLHYIVDACKTIMKPKQDKQRSRGINPRAIRAMVCGIPNVGKSTLINRVVKKKIAVTANKPGVTRALQWIKLNSELELLDTPGVLWPKFDDENVAMCLALTGAINDQILNLEDVAVFALKDMLRYYPTVLEERYSIVLQEDPYKVLQEIGESKKLIMKDNTVDYKRTIEQFLHDIRNDKLGKMTWENANA